MTSYLCALTSFFMWKSILFLGTVLLLVAANLLLANDYATPFIGAEVAQLKGAVLDGQAFTMPQFLSKSVALGTREMRFFLLRMPGVLFFASGMLAWFFLGTKLLGRSLAGFAALATGSMLAVPFLVKTATGDSWLLVSMSCQILFLMIALKSEKKIWRIGYWFCALVALTTAVVPTLLWAAAGGILVKVLHPGATKLRGLLYWPGWLLLAAAAFWSGIHALPSTEYLWVSYGSTPLSGWAVFWLIGLVPWLGFLPAAIAEMVTRLKRREEMAVFTAVWLGSALASGTAALIPAIAFLTSRQALRFFRKGYPWGTWVKTGFILQQIMLFLITFFYLLDSADTFGPGGFRQAMITGLMLWIPGLGILIGLFSQKPTLTWGSLLAAGLLPVFIGLSVYYPMIESRRNLPNRLTEQLEKGGISRLYVSAVNPERIDQLQLCLHNSGMTVLPTPANDAATQRPAVLLAPISEPSPGDTVSQSGLLDWWTLDGRLQFQVETLN